MTENHEILQESKILLKNRILIVDDEPDIAQVLKMGLEENGFAVDTYNDPLDAILNFKADSYDLLLIDIKMPKMNGFELYNRLHQIDKKAKSVSLLHMNFIMTNLRFHRTAVTGNVAFGGGTLHELLNRSSFETC